MAGGAVFLQRARMKPTDEDVRMLLETYTHCRKWAHAGQVGSNAVTLIAALEELLERRKQEKTQA